MQDQIEIEPVSCVRGSIRPPGSKSITNRALVCSALADGTSTLTGALRSDDTRFMIDGLRRLGFDLDLQGNDTLIRVRGSGGQIPAKTADIFVGNSGTTVRFLTAMVAAGKGSYRLDGIERMRARPIRDLLQALSDLGVDARSENDSNCPPVTVKANGLRGGNVSIRGDISSQYLSGLLMVMPCATKPSVIEIDGPLVSKPYVEMTLRVMKAFGVDVENQDDRTFYVPAKKYQAADYDIEPDASAASYFWAAAAITGGDVTVEGLSPHALQGDVQFCEILHKMGCQVEYGDHRIRVVGARLTGIEVDMNAISDTVQTLCAVAVFANGPTKITGVAHNRHKETDRIGDLATELRRLGADVQELEDGLVVTPRKLHSATIQTYDDHRMAMSLGADWFAHSWSLHQGSRLYQ